MAFDRTTWLRERALKEFEAFGVPLDGWNWTDEQMGRFLYGDKPDALYDEDLGYLDYPITFLHFPRSGKDILADYETYGSRGAQRKWAAEWALFRGETVPDEVLARYGLKQESEAAR